MPVISDNGIVMKRRLFEDSHYIITCFLQHHGMIRGMSWRGKTIISEGTEVQIVWRANTIEQLGKFSIQGADIPYLILSSPIKSFFLNLAIEVLNSMLSLRDPQLEIWQAFKEYKKDISEHPHDKNDTDYVRLVNLYLSFELFLLRKTGFSSMDNIFPIDVDTLVVSGNKNYPDLLSILLERMNAQENPLISSLLYAKEIPHLRQQLKSRIEGVLTQKSQRPEDLP